MGMAIGVVVAAALFLIGGLLLITGRRRDARRRETSPTGARSTAGVATLVPLVIVGVAITALTGSPSAARLHVGVLGLAATACAIGGSYYLLRYAKRTLQKQHGQPWTYDRVASTVLWLLAAGLALTALSLTTPN